MPTLVEAPYKSVEWQTDIVFASNDQPNPVSFAISRNAASMAVTVADMIADVPCGEEAVLPLSNVNGQTLKYICAYLEHHHDNRPAPIERPLRTPLAAVVSVWDRDFIYTDLIQGGDERQHALLIDVLMGAHYLNIKELVELCLAALASIIKGKRSDEIRDVLQIQNDYSPEEMARINEECKWCEES